MSVRAIRFRGIMALHFKRVVFSNGDGDTFDDAFSALSPDQRRKYDALGETIESSQVAIDWYGKGPKDKTACPDCGADCHSQFHYCPACGVRLSM
jgi:hypothetical protein